MIAGGSVLGVSDAVAARVVRAASTRLPTGHARFDLHGYRDTLTGAEHVALTLGDLAADLGGPPLVGLHPECLTGDALGSWRCDCGDQLQAALAAVAANNARAIPRGRKRARTKDRVPTRRPPRTRRRAGICSGAGERPP